MEAFRQEVRSWLEKNCPASMRTPMPEDETVWGGRNPEFKHPDSKVWLDSMAEKGWTTPTWPTEYGGGGLNPQENLVLQEELRAINARPALASFGIWMLGPALLEYASEEQKREHIPKIVRGEIRWCQGYSEPGAGSDLASLRTKCEDKGDYYLVNGQKVWTSYADNADWIFCLVRTGPIEPKHQGISFLLIDMASEGVSTKPIQLISGRSPFCETFFDNVQVSKENLVGELNGGWTIAKRLLEHERAMISAMSGRGEGSNLTEMALRYLGSDADGRLDDPAVRDQLAHLMMDGQAFALTLRRAALESKGGGPSATSSMFKLYGTEFNKRRYEMMLDLSGTRMLGWEGNGFEPDELRRTRSWLRTKANSIEGGTSEVQLNVIAKRVLGLPD